MDATQHSPHAAGAGAQGTAGAPMVPPITAMTNLPSSLTELPGTKRRRLRKGTHSCWECKRRKMGCMFDPAGDGSQCNGCRRRGSQCVSQDLPEEVSLSINKGRKPISVINPVSVPDALASLPLIRPSSGTSDGSTSNERSPLTSAEDGTTPASSTSGRSNQDDPPSRAVREHVAALLGHPGRPRTKYEHLSRRLHSSLPTRETTERIYRASRQPSVLGHQMLTMPYAHLEHGGLKTPESLLDIPGPEAHPVLLAKHMLLLATSLQHVQADIDPEAYDSAESPRALMERLVDLAMSIDATSDDIFSSVEGLECVMIESVYQANIGNVRRSWLSCRKAMNIAQLMGLDKSENHTRYKVLDPRTEYNPQLMWFRMVFLDRYLCLLLGLAPGSQDQSMASNEMFANDTPMGRVERIYCVVAAKILRRNEVTPIDSELDRTRSLDADMQKAAKSLPSKWWLVPSLEVGSTDLQALFWDTRRIFTHILHYNLLNQLHLPFMLGASSAQGKYEYSRMTCVNASREVLSRFIILRRLSTNRIAYRCCTIDFLALMAAMTLLLAHLDSPHADADNFLAHQYYSDRAMIVQILENSNEVHHRNSDALTMESANILRRLLTIEPESSSQGPKRVIVTRTTDEACNSHGVPMLSVRVPYFGVINIYPRTTIQEAIHNPINATTGFSSLAEPHGETGSDSDMMVDAHCAPPSTFSQALDIQQQLPPGITETTNHALGKSLHTPRTSNVASPVRHQKSHPDAPWQYGDFQEMNEWEEWPVHGLDLAFWASLIQGAGEDEMNSSG